MAFSSVHTEQNGPDQEDDDETKDGSLVLSHGVLANISVTMAVAGSLSLHAHKLWLYISASVNILDGFERRETSQLAIELLKASAL
jgi:hypothetical protein